jgi:hypothetical protein
LERFLSKGESCDHDEEEEQKVGRESKERNVSLFHAPTGTCCLLPLLSFWVRTEQAVMGANSGCDGVGKVLVSIVALADR